MHAFIRASAVLCMHFRFQCYCYLLFVENWHEDLAVCGELNVRVSPGCKELVGIHCSPHPACLHCPMSVILANDSVRCMLKMQNLVT